MTAPLRYTYRLVTNRYFWLGLAGMTAAILAGCFVVDRSLMPWYTRHNAVIQVPDLRGSTIGEAKIKLEKQDLRLGDYKTEYSADSEPSHVYKQFPHADTQVKPGRTVAITINSGEKRQVRVPDVLDLSKRAARVKIEATCLREGGCLRIALIPDSLPSPSYGNVTRQSPVAGTLLSPEDSVRVWYATGPRTHKTLQR